MVAISSVLIYILKSALPRRLPASTREQQQQEKIHVRWRELEPTKDDDDGTDDGLLRRRRRRKLK